MRSFFRIMLLALYCFSLSSFNDPFRPAMREQLDLCEGVKKIMQAFAEEDHESLLGGVIIMGEENQRGSKITINKFRDHFVYDDYDYSYFEATLDKKLKSVEVLKREMYYIASVLQTCLSVSMKYNAIGDDIMYEYVGDGVSVLIWGKHVNSNERTISIEIGYE
jgi:hypothetical protein